jgi:primosomal protein N' (replication factor Y)
VIKKGLKFGSVLVVMAETGYVSAMACQKCRNQARCICGGKLYIPSKTSHPKCFLCDSDFKDWECTWCNGKNIRAISKGSARYAEEIGKAVPGTRVLISKGASRLDVLPDGSENVLVIASYGCAPLGAYTSIVLKSLENLTNRVDLRSLEFARRVIFENINRLSVSEGSAIHLDISSSNPISQGVLRNDAYRLCLDEIEERKSSNLPPFTRLATLVGESSAIRALARNLEDNPIFAAVSVINNSLEKGAANQTSKLVLRSEIARSEEFSEFFRDLSRYRGIKALSPLQLRMDPFSI